jgi:cellulose synthase/poly-beta-1,6-N-acetylglucosamine synthase-like glycosyltransferase
MTIKPQLVAPEYGKHNEQIDSAIARLKQNSHWKKLDCIMIIPAGGEIPTKVVSSWMNLYSPPNNKFYRIFAIGLEVGQAFSTAIENILAHPQLAEYKYIITLEHDNIPPPDGIIKLLEQMENHPEFAGIGGLYWTKGPGGQPQIWGNPRDVDMNFRPQLPVPNALIECCGTGMGFNAFRLSMFKDPKLRKPWFKTQTEGGVSTQDLYFWSDARQHGYRCAVDCSILVGHYDYKGDFGIEDTVW